MLITLKSLFSSLR